MSLQEEAGDRMLHVNVASNKPTELNILILENFVLAEQISELTEQRDLVKTKIKMLMDELGEEFYEDVEGNSVSYKEQTRNSLNRKLVEQKLAPEVFSECFKATTFKTLRILSVKERQRVKEMSKK